MNDTDNRELIEALDELEKEKEISKDIILEAIENSLLAAVRTILANLTTLKSILIEKPEKLPYLLRRILLKM